MIDRGGAQRSELEREKALLRSWAKSQPRATEHESRLVSEFLADWLRRQAPSRILTYDAMPGEVSVDSVAEDLGDRHHFFLTRTPESGPLTIHPREGPVERHIFGFRQPTSLSMRVDPATIDVVLTPGLCFDRRGGRLGWGKGYFDELLARMPILRAVVGVSLSRFVIESVPLEPHDRRMTHLVTEDGLSPVSA